MKINKLRIGMDEHSYQPVVIIELEMPIEPVEHYSNLHKREYYAMIGEQLVNALEAARPTNLDINKELLEAARNHK